MAMEIKQTVAFAKWVGKLRDAKAKAFIGARIVRLAHGLQGDVSPVGEGVSELRIHYGPIAAAKALANAWSQEND